MAKNLFLDDWRKPNNVYPDLDNFFPDAEHWHLVTTYEEFVEYLEQIANSAKTEDMPPIVSFDYMLGTQKDGADCAKFLVDFCIKYGLKLPDCNVHSTYPYATREIKKEIYVYAERLNEDYPYVALVKHNAS